MHDCGMFFWKAYGEMAVSVKEDGYEYLKGPHQTVLVMLIVVASAECPVGDGQNPLLMQVMLLTSSSLLLQLAVLNVILPVLKAVLL